MKHNDFYRIYIAPARHKGEQLILKLSCDDNSVYRLGVSEADAHGFIPGDSAYIRTRVMFEDSSDTKYIKIYLTGDILDDFTRIFGVKRITGDFDAVLELCYTVEESMSPDDSDEFYGFKLMSFTPMG